MKKCEVTNTGTGIMAQLVKLVYTSGLKKEKGNQNLVLHAGETLSSNFRIKIINIPETPATTSTYVGLVTESGTSNTTISRITKRRRKHV